MRLVQPLRNAGRLLGRSAAALERIVGVRSERSTPAHRRVKNLTRAAAIERDAGRLDEAAQLLDQAAHIFPGHRSIGSGLMRLHRSAGTEGRPDVALGPARTAYLLAPADERIGRALLRALRDCGRAHHDAGRSDAALTAFREARALERDLGLAPSSKLRTLAARVLLLEARAVLRDGRDADARVLLEEALTAYPDHAKCLELSRRLADVSGSERGLGAGPPSEHGGRPDLVLVEDNIDEDLLGTVLSRLDGADCYALRRLRHFSEGDVVLPVHSVHDLGTAGLSDDVELCRRTDAHADVVRATVREHLPSEAVRSAGVDVLDHMAYDFDDAAFRAGRLLQLANRLVHSGGHGRCFFILGDGRLLQALGTATLRRFGAEGTWTLWCSAAVDRRERAATRLVDRSEVQVLPTIRVEAMLAAAAGPQPEPDTSAEPPALGGVAVVTTPYPPVVGNLVPVIDELDPRLPVTFVVAAGERRRPGYVPYTSCADNEPSRRQVRELEPTPAPVGLREALGPTLKRLATSERLEELSIDGAPVWPLLEPMVAGLLTKQLPALARFTTGFDRYLAAARPAVTVVGPDRATLCRLACALARRSGIPSVFPQSMIIGESPRLKALDADVATVNDRYTRRLLYRAHGTALDRLRITGIPRFDAIERARQERPPVANGRCVVALILQRFAPEYGERWIELVAGAVAARPDVRLLVRPHPGEPAAARARYAALLARLDRDGRFAIDEGHLYDLLADATVVVGAFSNVILEAAMFGRVALSANLTGGPLPAHFADRGIAVGADGEGELREQLLALLDHEDAMVGARARQEAFFARNPQLRDGRSARRVAEVIESLAPAAPLPAATLQE